MNGARTSKPDDNENIEKAIKLLFEMFELNRQIEPTLWMPCLVFALANAYSQSGFSYKYFRKEMDEAFETYKDLFD